MSPRAEGRARGAPEWIGGLLPWIAAAAFVAIALLWLGRDKRMAREAYEPYSVHNTSGEGLSLAYRYLKERARRAGPCLAGTETGPAKVGLLTRPLERSGLEADATVFRVRPSTLPPAALLRRSFRGRRSTGSRRPRPERPPRRASDEVYPPGRGRGRERHESRRKERAREEGQPEERRSGEEAKGPEDAEDAEDVAPADPALQPGRVGNTDRTTRPNPGDTPLTPEEFSWVYGGGRLVLAIDRGYCGLLVERAASGASVGKVYPVWPGVKSLRPPRLRRLEGELTARMVSLIAVGDGALVGRWLVGEGSVIAIASPEMLRNDSVGEADHLSLLEALAGLSDPDDRAASDFGELSRAGPPDVARPRGRPVYFDEYVHGLGTGTGTFELLRSWGLGPLVVFSVVGALSIFWRQSVRIGPEEEDYEETRVEAVEFVDSLAQLYNRALQRVEAVALYEEAFRRDAAVATGLRGEALEARIRDITKGLDIPTSLGAASSGQRRGPVRLPAASSPQAAELSSPKSDRAALRVTSGDGPHHGSRALTAGRPKDVSAHVFKRYLRGLNEAFGRLDDVKRR